MINLTFEQKDRIYNALFYFFMSVVVVWIILKLVGIIQTPLWLELLPLVALALSMFVAFSKVVFYFGSMFQDLKYIKKKVKRNGVLMEQNKNSIQKLDTKFDSHVIVYNHHLEKYHL